MEHIRSSKFRKWLISLFLIVGIFPSIQAAFACEKIDDRIQFKTDCMQMDAGSAPCPETQDCISNASSSDLSVVDACCDLISHVVTHVRSNSYDSSLDKILLFDNVQPPPILGAYPSMFNVFEVASFSRLSIVRPKPYSASDIYLQTQRFRI